MILRVVSNGRPLAVVSATINGAEVTVTVEPKPSLRGSVNGGGTWVPVERVDISEPIDVVAGQLATSASGKSMLHGAARWALAILPLLDSPQDPRTMLAWATWVAMSPGAIRARCRSVGISPRRSLLFARLLRVTAQCSQWKDGPGDLLDIVDRRTLRAICREAGLGTLEDWPRTIKQFIERQRLVPHAQLLTYIERGVDTRRFDADGAQETRLAVEGAQVGGGRSMRR